MKNGELGPILSDITEFGARLSVSLDFRGIRTMSASTLSKLLILRRNLRALGGRLILRNVPPFVSEVFRVTHLDRVFEVRRRRTPRGALPARHQPQGIGE